MKSRFISRSVVIVCGCFALVNSAFAQVTAFTYQGRLNDGASAANGSYDLRFAIFDDIASGAQQGNTITNAASSVSNGLFTVSLDFGNQFPGAARWLEIGVRTNGGYDFATLSPRQQITATPYAVQAANAATAASASSVAAANISGTLATAQLPDAVVTNGASGVTVSGTFAGDGAGLTGVDLVTVNRHGAISFTPRFVGAFAADPSVGSESYWVTAADVDNDGLADLISVNTSSNAVEVLRNNGGSSFSVFAYAVGNDPRSVFAARLNGDTSVDLVVANYGNNTLTVLLNDGGGQFNSGTSLPVGNGPRSVVVADVNGDGKKDLISANSGNNTVTVWFGNGFGSFFPGPMPPSVGSDPRSVTAADVNGDGKMDLITANYGNNTLTILTNGGFGSFVLASSPSVGSNPKSVVAADVNSDGKPDLICANTGADTLTVLTNNGSGGFAIASSPGVGSEPDSVLAADVNGDGKPDLISANFGSKSLSVLTNNGSGGFALASSPTAFGKPYSVAAGDVNGDGALDLIAANLAYPLAVLLNTPDQSASFTGDGGALTNVSVNASHITGTIPLAQLPAGLVTNGAAAVSLSGTFAGSGAGLTNLNASNISSGTLSNARLSPNVPLLDGANLFSGTNRFAGEVVMTNENNQLTGTFSGNGAGLTGINPGSLGAGTAAIDISGNAATAGNFSGTLVGDVTGTQSATFVGTVGGQSAADVASGAGAANAASSANAAGTIVKRDASGNFSAGAVTATSISGDGSALTSLHAGNLSTGTVADARLSANVALLNSSNLFTGPFVATNADNQLAGSFAGDGGGLTNLSVSGSQITGTLALSQLPAGLVTNGASGLTLAGTFSGNGAGLTGLNPANLGAGTAAINISGSAASAATATTANNFSGALTGDVTGTQPATVVSTVGGQSATNVAGGASAANAATSANTVGTIVKRDASGNFSAGAITAASLSGNGSALTSLNADNLSSGTVADARHSANVARLDGTNVFTGTNRFASTLVATNAGNLLAGSFAGNGGGLSNLNGSQITGTVPLAQLPAAVVTNGASGLNLTGAFTGNGASLTNLAAANLATGTLADARLSANVPLLNGTNVFSGTNRFSNVLVATNANNQFSGAFTGNGSGLTQLPAVVVTNGASGVSLAGSFTGNGGGLTNISGLADNSVTVSKIASGQVVKNLNGLKDSVTLVAGSNLALMTNGNNLQLDNIAPVPIVVNSLVQKTNYTSAGTYTITVPIYMTNVTVKLWGAGGGGGNNSSGGGGGFASVSLAVVPGEQYTIVVGQRGAASITNLGGAGSNDGEGGAPGLLTDYNQRGQGGQASSLFKNSGAQFITKAVAGGGGGAGLGSGGNGGAGGGGNGGVQLDSVAGLGGTNGVGGTGGFGGQAGNNYSANATSIGEIALNLMSGKGGNAQNWSGGGGGGYGGGGGGGGGSGGAGAGGGGGGSYGSTTIIGGTGNGQPGNLADSDYIAPQGNGGFGSGVAGNDGLVAVTLSGLLETLSVPLIATNSYNQLGGDGSGLTNLNASNISSGTLADARLSANVARLNANQTFTGSNSFSGVATLANANNTLNGNGSGLTSLNAANVSSGTLADARLSANVPLLNGTNVFSGTNTFSGTVTATNVNNQFGGTFTGTLYASAPYLKFAEVTANVAAGATVAGTNNWREFNLKLTDTHSLGSTNGTGDINLPAGTYQCRISAPAFRVEFHQIRLRTSTGTNLLFGTTGYSDSSSGGSEDRSQIEGQFTLPAAATLRVQHYCRLANATGLGNLAAFTWGDENQYIFAVAEFWKIK